jgi:hypothetical protein
VRLVDARVEAGHPEREIYRIQVVQIVTSEGKTAHSNRAGKERNLSFLPGGHVFTIAIEAPTCGIQPSRLDRYRAGGYEEKQTCPGSVIAADAF